MAPPTVMLKESLRPWRNAGLEFILDEHGLFAAAEAQQADPVRQAPPAAQRALKPPQASHRAPQTAPTSSLPPRPHEASTTRPTQKAPDQPASTIRPKVASGLAIHPTLQPPEEWPATWQQVWSKMKVPCPAVWTYWSLGDDLCGRANAERGALLRKIIGPLQLPAGSSAFWPVAIHATPETPELIAAPEIFLAGLRRIRPRYCITFGSRALKTFAPDAALAPYTFTQFMGHRLIALPDIDILLKNQGTVPAVIAFLKTAVTLRG